MSINKNYPCYRKKWRPNMILVTLPVREAMDMSRFKKALKKYHEKIAQRGANGFRIVGNTPGQVIKQMELREKRERAEARRRK